MIVRKMRGRHLLVLLPILIITGCRGPDETNLPKTDGIVGNYFASGANGFQMPWQGVYWSAKYVFSAEGCDVYCYAHDYNAGTAGWTLLLKAAKVTRTPNTISVSWAGCTKDSPCGKFEVFNTTDDLFDVQSDGLVLRSPTSNVVLMKQ